MKKLEYAIELRNITSEAKSKGGSKGGSCGTDKDHRVVKAQAKVEKLLDATVVDKDAIEAAMKKLKDATIARDSTLKAKNKGRSKGGKYIH
jgi:hypothetical protein